MAYIFPSAPTGTLPPAVLRTFQFLKSLPDDYVVWHHMAPWEKESPDFLILNSNRQALLVKVSQAAPAEARPIAQLLLIEDERPPLGMAEERVLRGFLEGCREQGLEGGIPTTILFPNIPVRPLLKSRPADHPVLPVWLGREYLQPDSFDAWSQLFSGHSLDTGALDRLRARFTPEIVVPRNLTVRTPYRRLLEAGLTDYLLDYDQEAALKADLDLPQEGNALYRDFRLSLVNGVAGSGKTLILLYRLRLLYDLYPGKRFLVLTHNRPLNHDMQSRFHRLYGYLPERITWDTFLGWCRANWPKEVKWLDPLGKDRRQRLIRAVWVKILNKHPAGEGITETMLRSEIDWLKDQASFDPELYLNADRRGRGFRLTQEQRKRVLTAIARYESLLKEQQAADWGDIPRRMLEFLRSGQVQPLEYDVILVDEAQFFAPVWFEIVRRLLKPQSGHLFMAADPTQGFLRQGISWRSLGLEVRGHSYHLKRSYRTTHEILNFATLFYRQRVLEEREDDEVLAPDLLNMPNGTMPQLIQVESPQDEIARTANEIAALVKQGVPKQDILALHAGWQGARELIRSLERRLGRGAAGDPKDTYPGNYVRVTTLNAGTGLEGPIVFLLGLHPLFEEEQSLRLADEEREQVIFENTRKIYMAITRAGQRLVFTYVGPLPEALKGLKVIPPGSTDELTPRIDSGTGSKRQARPRSGPVP